MNMQSGIRTRARGFAGMEKNKQREIARRGGRAAHAQGTAHEFSPEEARLAGRKGGVRVSGNREYMASIGRRGGAARHARRKVLRAEATPPDSDAAKQQADEAASSSAADATAQKIASGSSEGS